MKFLFKDIFIFLFCISSLSAQEAAPLLGASQEAATKPIANSLLWAITGEGIDTSYLYGTIHLIGKEDFFLTDATKKAFNKSKKVTFEINMEDMTDISAQMGLMMKALMNNDTKLSDLLDEERYGEVKAHFAKLGINDFMWPMMERLKPMFLSIFASMDMTSGGGMNMDAMKSYEMEFMKMAKEGQKTMGGLETAEYQMSMFDSIPYKDQAEMLYASMQAEETSGDQLEEMVKLYKKQDLNGMMELFAADKEGIGKYDELLLVVRNKNWIPIMQDMMSEAKTFFAVGAGHLGGENGVVNLLRKQGYKLTPMNYRTL